MNLSTYFLCYWLFSSALTTLLDRFYITKRRLRTHISLWVIFPSFLHRADVVAGRDFADNCAVCSGCVAGHLWIRLGPQAYSGI